MWNTPKAARLAKIPALGTTQDTPAKDKIIHLHFFMGGCDWYIAEFDGDDLFWGFTVLNGDLQMAEWGYSSFYDLQSINIKGLQVDCDLHWTPKPANEVELICKAQGWQL